jgi:integrase
MKLPQIKGIHRVRSKVADGTTVEYHYVFRGGPKFWTSLDTVPKNGPAYFQLYTEALGDRSPALGKFREIILKYLKSPEFKDLADRSKKDINTSISHPKGIDATFGDAPIAAFNDPKIRKVVYDWRDDWAERSYRTADARIAHLAAIVSFALDRGLLVQHHLQKVKKLYVADRSEIIWTNAEIDEFVRIAPKWVGNILIVATETGLRPGDIKRLNRAHLDKTLLGSRIVMNTNKRGRVVSIPITKKMQALLDDLPAGQLQVIVGQKGAPIANPDRLGQTISRWKQRTSITRDINLYDARGTAATRLFRAGLALHDIALFMGWTPQHAAKMIEIYCSFNPDDNSDILIELEKHK